MKFNNIENWNEFRWEQELKMQDKHISAYFSALDKYIDLPGESELVMKSLDGKTYVKAADLGGGSDFFGDEKEINDALFLDYSANKSSIKIFNRIAALASDFNLVLSKEKDGNVILKGLKIVSIYGKLLANFVDYIDLEEDILPALKIALTKRIVFFINDIIGNYKELKPFFPDDGIKIERYIKELLFVRELIVDIRYKCKTAR